MRREPRHPGARRCLFASENYRYWEFLTDTAGSPAHVDTLMRRRAHIADSIKWLTDSGLEQVQFTAWNANRVWTAMCLIALALVTWFQTRELTDALAKAATKRLHRQLWRLTGILSRHARRTLIHIPARHPAAQAFLAAKRLH